MELRVTVVGKISALGPGWGEVTPVEIKAATLPLVVQTLSWKQEASVLALV